MPYDVARSGDGLRARVLPSAADVDPHAWDALVRDADFFHCHRWLRGLDHALGPAQVLAVDGAAGLLGGCALWRGERARSGLFALPELFADLAGPWADEFLWLGARRATHIELPCTRGAHRRAVLDCLFSSALREAERCGLAGVVVPYMPLRHARELAEHQPRAAVLLHSAEASLSVPAGGLGEMQSSHGKHYRSISRNELSRFRSCGNRVEWRAVDDALIETAARLITGNRAKYGSTRDESWMRRILEGQHASGVLDTAVAAIARRGDRVTAVTIFYRFGEVLHSRYFGSDYSVDDNDFRYFALTYYLPLDYAASHGLREYRLSTSALEAKVHRGSRLEPQAAVVALAHGARLDAGEAERHNTRFLSDYRRRFSSYLTPDWSGALH